MEKAHKRLGSTQKQGFYRVTEQKTLATINRAAMIGAMRNTLQSLINVLEPSPTMEDVATFISRVCSSKASWQGFFYFSGFYASQ